MSFHFDFILIQLLLLKVKSTGADCAHWWFLSPPSLRSVLHSPFWFVHYGSDSWEDSLRLPSHSLSRLVRPRGGTATRPWLRLCLGSILTVAPLFPSTSSHWVLVNTAPSQSSDLENGFWLLLVPSVSPSPAVSYLCTMSHIMTLGALINAMSFYILHRTWI